MYSEIEFFVVAETNFGETVAVATNQPCLGYWECPLPLSTSDTDYPIWKTKVQEIRDLTGSSNDDGTIDEIDVEFKCFKVQPKKKYAIHASWGEDKLIKIEVSDNHKEEPKLIKIEVKDNHTEEPNQLGVKPETDTRKNSIFLERSIERSKKSIDQGDQLKDHESKSCNPSIGLYTKSVSASCDFESSISEEHTDRLCFPIRTKHNKGTGRQTKHNFHISSEEIIDSDYYDYGLSSSSVRVHGSSKRVAQSNLNADKKKKGCKQMLKESLIQICGGKTMITPDQSPMRNH